MYISSLAASKVLRDVECSACPPSEGVGQPDCYIYGGGGGGEPGQTERRGGGGGVGKAQAQAQQ